MSPFLARIFWHLQMLEVPLVAWLSRRGGMRPCEYVPKVLGKRLEALSTFGEPKAPCGCDLGVGR